MMKKLYSLSLPPDAKRAALYLKGPDGCAVGRRLLKGQTLDFTTYFNAFCLEKWREYTTITAVQLELEVCGRFRIVFKIVDADHESVLFVEECGSGHYRRTLALGDDAPSGALLGVALTCLEDGGAFVGGAWSGEFDCWREKTIGIVICSFRREGAVERTLRTLHCFMQDNPWLHVLVVDNGGTLLPRDEGDLRVIRSRNCGGSGGFALGMIDAVGQKNGPDVVILMDDDILLDATAVERTHSLLCGLKEGYADCFLAGAMLSAEEPSVQFENTACWRSVTYRSNNSGWDLTDPVRLAQNCGGLRRQNQYAGWWFCCIPTSRIRAIGYPLPLFIKSDDMEYSFRNDRAIMTMNGIGVWHQTFCAKQNLVMSYYANRNSLIIQHYAKGCSRWTVLLAILLKSAKRVLRLDGSELHMLARAVRDYAAGFPKLTELPAAVLMQDIARYAQEPFSWADLVSLCGGFMRVLLEYGQIDRGYRTFRDESCADADFWKEYLMR